MILLKLQNFILTAAVSVFSHRLPEEDMNAAELIRNQGYPEEDHQIVTEDGYVLGVQRIPHGIHEHETRVGQNLKPAILLVHGLMASSTDWIDNLYNQSLAFILADAGYDVWLGNVRGNAYSQRHLRLSPKQKKFWDFSWQEMAEYDLPAMVNYILKNTGNHQIFYVGHSQGTLIAFAKLSSDLEFAKKNLMNDFHHYSTGSVTWILDYIKPVCDDEKIDRLICENIMMFLIGGEDTKLLNQTRIPVYLAHNPAGTSVKNIAHFGQNVMSKKMQKFNYGFLGNLRKYGQLRPPVYRVEKMRTFTVVFWSKKDVFGDSKDVALLLPKITQGQVYRIEDFSHIDFLFAITARRQVYDHILKVLQTY